MGAETSDKGRIVNMTQFNDLSSPAALLATRRSAKARDLIAPGPDAGELAAILHAAARVPDHGKLAPWRFVEIVDRAAFADLLVREWQAERGSSLDPAPLVSFAHDAPVLVAVLFAPVAGKIPLWEQELSCGAACMNLLHAAHARGFAGNWLTGWAAQSARVCAALGGGPDDKVAGYFFLGTPSQPLEERPRPETDTIVRKWPVA